MTLYLSRLTLDRNAPAAAIASLLDPQERSAAADAHHKLVWTAFADQRDRERDFLWRADGAGRFFTLSPRPPVQNDLFAPLEIKPFEPSLRPGDLLQFTMRVNATRQRRLTKGADRQKSQRVDIVMDRLFNTVAREQRTERRDAVAQAAAEDWMAEQGKTKGFEPLEVLSKGYHTLEIARPRRKARLGILDLEGVIRVTDPDIFLSNLAAGFGRAKAWGCGLMLIKRAA